MKLGVLAAFFHNFRYIIRQKLQFAQYLTRNAPWQQETKLFQTGPWLLLLLLLLSPAKRRDIVLDLSVCPSVRPSRSFLILCAYRLRDYATHTHETYTIWKLRGLDCVIGGPFFPAPPPNFGVIGLWKRPKITYSNFWSFITQRVFDPHLRYLYHMKAQLL